MIKLERYKNNILKNGIDIASQEKLFSSKVLVMGAGGLGSSVIMNLAALGIGQIKIVDDDILKEEDLNCQIIHKYKNINRAKVMSAKDWISEFNSDIKVEIDKIKLNDLNYFNIIDDYDIIVDCFNDDETKYVLNEIALRHDKILVHAKTKGFMGQVTTIVPKKTACLCCIMPKPKIFKKENDAELSPVINVISALQAQEVLKIITGYGEPLLNKIIMFDGLKSEFKTINYSKNVLCECCTNIGEYNYE